MDGDRFDDALRQLGQGLTRRNAARMLAALGLGAIGGDSGRAARRKPSKCSRYWWSPLYRCTCGCDEKFKRGQKDRQALRRKGLCKRNCEITYCGEPLCQDQCVRCSESETLDRTTCQCVPACPAGSELCNGQCVSCPAAHTLDPATCQCHSSCPAGSEPCNGSCLPGCPAGAARNPVSCVCCLPTGVSCGPLPPSAPCCFPAGTGACGVGNVCAGQTNGQPCQFSGQCQPGVNCINNICTP